MSTGTVLHNFIEAKIISAAFLYPDENWRRAMNELAKEGIAQKVFSLAKEIPLELLASEHALLFGSNPACSSDLAEHMSEQPFNKAQKMAEMAGFYRAFGLEVKDGARPDNISACFEFLSYMYQKKIYAQDKGHSRDKMEILDKALADFTNEFITPTCPKFFAKLAKATSNKYYRALAKYSSEFVTSLGGTLRKTGGHPSPEYRTEVRRVSPRMRFGKVSPSLLAVFAAIVAATCISSAQAKEVLIKSTSAKTASLEPADEVWTKAQTVTVPLIKQTMVAPHGGGSVQSLEVSSIYTDSEIYIRLSWQDATRDATYSMTEKYSDAVAVEFPLKESTLPSSIMGEKGLAVNIWQWRAIAEEMPEDRFGFSKAYSDFYRYRAINEFVKYEPKSAVESLVAEGFGTITPTDMQDISGRGVWNEGRWTVIVKRKLSAKQGARFKKNIAVPVAFAVWDGSDSDRNGKKSVSFWHTLVIGDASVEQPKDILAQGRRAYERFGCVTCHGRDGKGKVANLNAQGGFIPAVDKVKEGYSEKELKKLLRQGRKSDPENPRGPAPPLAMVGFSSVMDEDELDALAEYLFSLAPETEKW